MAGGSDKKPRRRPASPAPSSAGGFDPERLIDLLRRGRVDDLTARVARALEEGVAPKTLLDEALLPAMLRVGDDFKHNRIYVPEVLISSRAMKEATALIAPLLVDDDAPPRGTIVIGTVAGDLHDIGKNLVAMLAGGVGFHVVDLGVDVSADRFIDAALENEAGIVALSALLTTTMPTMAHVVGVVREDGPPGCKTVIGGAPTTATFAREIGADGYAPDAGSAVDEFIRLATRTRGAPSGPQTRSKKPTAPRKERKRG